MKELVTVIVPVLNPDINPVEERLLHHSLQMLSGYPLIFVTYEGADLSIVREHHEDIDIVHFPAEFFRSRDAFARLLLMEDFYLRFNWCDFLMVHELNSWIIKDELYYWCKQGYDFMKAGAAGHVPGNFFQQLTGYSPAQKEAFASGFENNGLYLCRIERMLSTLAGLKKTAYQYRHDTSLHQADAVFWKCEANRLWPRLRKPSRIVTDHFARNVADLAELKPDRLPFALTGITRANFNQIPFFKSMTEADQ
ncbi:DUF5672 family protein [Dyadobacter sandarakinus]|uniref:DUF5672 domain-containing protein n=1 Tax=Dyadobacter sandarakinus TaxID=2747268 RepID=A0ABX7ICA3_9BACT|nr:DUF5672 family protein [Dyadobacter sandarakinus]QRR03737.1 hypothetical protein HWI92_23885 [Dyadobacter sandarakinus]